MASLSDPRSMSPEKKSSQSDSLYRELFHLTNVIKLILDPATLEIVEANPAACAFYGYSAEQIRSLNIKDISVLTELEIRATFQAVIAGKRTLFETQHRLISGEIRDVEVQAGVIKQSDKNYVYAVIQDITERKQMESALRKSERLHRLFAQNMPDASVVMFDTDMRYTLVEGPFLKRFGSLYEGIVGKLPQEALTSQEALDFIVPVYQRALRGESFSYERQTPDYAYEAHVAPIEAEDGQIVGGMVLSHDISKQKQTVEALKTSEERFRSTFDYAPIGMALVALDGGWLDVNPALCRIVGYSSEELLQKTFQDITHPDDLELDLQNVRDLLAGKLDSYCMEKRYFHKQGHTVWVLLSVSLVRDKAGAPLYFISQIEDITERKRLENELRRNEEQLRLVTDNMQDMITSGDAEDCIVYASPSSRLLLGYEPEEMTGHFRHEFIPPQERDRLKGARKQIIQQGLEHATMEGRLRHADGHYVNVETVARFLYDEDGSYSGGIFVTRDISERKQFEAALIENEEKYRLIAENTSDGISVFDAVTQSVIYTSPSYDKLLGLEPGEIFTLPVASYADFIHPEDREQILTKIRNAITHKATHLISVYRSLPKRGQEFWREDHGKFTYASDGSLLRIDVVSRDITERKQMEDLKFEKQKLETSIEKEQELSHLKTLMMERVTHEFRTPLTTIQAATETLIHYYDRLTPEKRDEKSVTVKNQIRQITDMLDEINIVIRGADTLGHLSRVRTDLYILCQEIASELSTALKLPDKYVIEVEGKPLAIIDPDVIHDSLTHIMGNAARYSEAADPVTVRIAQTGDSIEIRIVDQGIGISGEELPRIFEPFFRGSNINERGGLGVGLTIARAAIEAHGGTIRAESKVGKGTTFIIRLPGS